MTHDTQAGRTKRRAAKPAATPAAVAPIPAKSPSKLELIADLLRRPQGASLEELMQLTGWQAHSVRGALSAGVRKKMKLNLTSQKADGRRTYRVIEDAAA